MTSDKKEYLIYITTEKLKEIEEKLNDKTLPQEKEKLIRENFYFKDILFLLEDYIQDENKM